MAEKRYSELKIDGQTYTEQWKIDEVLIKNKFNWMVDAEIKNARLEIFQDTLVWNGGTWYNGDWYFGVWRNGEWRYGNWQNGVWYNGTWINGTFNSGIIFNGKFHKGKILGGEIRGGFFFNVEIAPAVVELTSDEYQAKKEEEQTPVAQAQPAQEPGKVKFHNTEPVQQVVAQPNIQQEKFIVKFKNFTNEAKKVSESIKSEKETLAELQALLGKKAVWREPTNYFGDRHKYAFGFSIDEIAKRYGAIDISPAAYRHNFNFDITENLEEELRKNGFKVTNIYVGSWVHGWIHRIVTIDSSTKSDINEGVKDIFNKVVNYGKKGILTAALLLSLAVSQEAYGKSDDIIKIGIQHIYKLEQKNLNAALAAICARYYQICLNSDDEQSANNFKELMQYYLDLRDDVKTNKLNDKVLDCQRILLNSLDKFVDDKNKTSIITLIDEGMNIDNAAYKFNSK